MNAYKQRRPYFRLMLAFTVLFLVIQACGLPFFVAPSPEPPGYNPSQVAQLVTLALQQTEMQQINAQLTIEAIAPSPTPVPPTETPTPTQTSTPTPTATWVPALTNPPTSTPFGTPPGAPAVTNTQAFAPGDELLPKIYAEIDSNCRAGPSIDFKRLGYLLVGETSVVIGRNRSSTWWYIKEPRRTGIQCWVWGGSTRVEGDTSNVPALYVPTPTSSKKTPSGSVSFSITGVHIIMCGGQQTVMVRVKNTGKNRLESAWMRVYDLSDNQTIFGPSSSDTPFRSSAQDCSAGGDQIEPGQTLYLGGGLGNQNITSHSIQVSVQMCTGEGLTGQCASDSRSYTAP